MSRCSAPHGLTQVEMTAENNLAYLCMTHDLPGAEEHCEVAVALPRRLGARSGEAVAAANLMYVLTFEGRFDEAYRLANDLLEAGADETRESGQLRIRLALLDAFRGELGSARSSSPSAPITARATTSRIVAYTQPEKAGSPLQRATTGPPSRRRFGRSTRYSGVGSRLPTSPFALLFPMPSTRRWRSGISTK